MSMQDNIFIYTLPKVGSSSLAHMFYKANGVQPTHIHWLYDDFVSRIGRHTEDLQKTCREKIEQSKEEITIFCGVRDLVSLFVSLSMHFEKLKLLDEGFIHQDLLEVTPDDNVEYITETSFGTEQRTMLPDILLARSLSTTFRLLYDEASGVSKVAEWFNLELKAATGVDIFDEPFDKGKGYMCFVKDNITIYVYRLDMFNVFCEEVVIPKYTPAISISRINASVLGGKYCYERVFDSLKFPEPIVSSLLNTKLMTHFYTKEELNNLLIRWGYGDF